MDFKFYKKSLHEQISDTRNVIQKTIKKMERKENIQSRSVSVSKGKSKSVIITLLKEDIKELKEKLNNSQNSQISSDKFRFLEQKYKSLTKANNSLEQIKNLQLQQIN